MRHKDCRCCISCWVLPNRHSNFQTKGLEVGHTTPDPFIIAQRLSKGSENTDGRNVHATDLIAKKLYYGKNLPLTLPLDSQEMQIHDCLVVGECPHPGLHLCSKMLSLGQPSLTGLVVEMESLGN